MKRLQVVAITAGALVLVAGSFTFASGALLDGSSSLLSAAITSFGQSIVVTRSSTSPSGTINGGTAQNIATFNFLVGGKPGSQGTIKSAKILIPISGSSASSLSLSEISAHYSYCIPGGKKYGYGYKSGGCGSIKLLPSSVARNGNTYVVTFTSSFTVYPEQSYGAFIVSALPYFTSSTVTGTPKFSASLQSVDSTPKAFVFLAKGNTLTVRNPYGYTNTTKPVVEHPGNPQPIIAPTSQSTTNTDTSGTSQTTTGTQSTTQSTSETNTGSTQTTQTRSVVDKSLLRSSQEP